MTPWSVSNLRVGFDCDASRIFDLTPSGIAGSHSTHAHEQQFAETIVGVICELVTADTITSVGGRRGETHSPSRDLSSFFVQRTLDSGLCPHGLDLHVPFSWLHRFFLTTTLLDRR